MWNVMENRAEKRVKIWKFRNPEESREKIEKIENKLWKDMENMEEKQVA